MKIRKRVRTLLLTALMMLMLIPGGLSANVVLPAKADAGWDGTAASSFQGGDGSKENPYKISTAKQLAYLAKSVNGGKSYGGSYLILTNDINLSGTEWKPIGENILFQGTFDGRGHKIAGLTIDSSDRYLGLFGSAYNKIENLRVTDFNIHASAESLVGGIVAECENDLFNCFASGTIVCKDESNNISPSYCDVGGIAGSVVGNVSYCYANCTVTVDCKDAKVGGLIGDCACYTVRNCYSTGSVASPNASNIGGLLGNSLSDVGNCYTTCGVTYAADGSDDADVGGLIGNAYCEKIKNCYVNSDISAGPNQHVGNVTGNYTHSQDSVSNVYWNSEKNVNCLLGNGTADEESKDIASGIPLDTMQTTLKDTLNSQLSAGYLKWIYIKGKNNDCPLLSGVGEGTTAKPSFGAIKYSAKSLTNKDVTVTAAVNNALVTSVSYTFSRNGSYTFTICNSIGDTASKTVKVTYIDKDPPTITVTAINNNTPSCKAYVTVTDTNLKSKIVKIDGKQVPWGNGYFNTPGYYDVIATDKAGNTATKSFYMYKIRQQ